MSLGASVTFDSYFPGNIIIFISQQWLWGNNLIYVYILVSASSVGHWSHTYSKKVTQRATTGSLWTSEEWGCQLNLKKIFYRAVSNTSHHEIQQKIMKLEPNSAFKWVP